MYSGANGKVALEAKGLAKAFGGLRAVREFDVEPLEGRITALIGSNGAGKTTVFNLITGFERPDSGEVIYRGVKLTTAAPHRQDARAWSDPGRALGCSTVSTVLENVLVARPGQASEALWRITLTPMAASR